MLVVLGALGGCKKREPGPEGDIVATLTAKTIDGADFDPSVLRGKPGLVMFVKATCPHCIEEMPLAQQVAREKDANVVAVFVQSNPKNAEVVVENTQFQAPALIDDGSLATRYKVSSVPYTVVIDAKGRSTEVLRGAHGASRLADALDDAR